MTLIANNILKILALFPILIRIKEIFQHKKGVNK